MVERKRRKPGEISEEGKNYNTDIDVVTGDREGRSGAQPAS